MRFLLAVVLVLTASVAFAVPFIVCDSYVAPAVIPDYFRITVDAGAEQQTPAWSGTLNGTPVTNILHFDVGYVAIGIHTVSVKACQAATLWNPEVCSVAVPFSFSRPAIPVAPNAPSGLSLSR